MIDVILFVLLLTVITITLLSFKIYHIEKEIERDRIDTKIRNNDIDLDIKYMKNAIDKLKNK